MCPSLVLLKEEVPRFRSSTLLTVGFKRAYVAFRECMRLKQTFTYLIFYFLVQVTPTASHATFSCSIYSWVQGWCFEYNCVCRNTMSHELFPVNRLTSFGRTVIATIQNRFVLVDWVPRLPFWSHHFFSVVMYSTLDLTLLLTVGIVAQALGIWCVFSTTTSQLQLRESSMFWLVQKRYEISTKSFGSIFTSNLCTLAPKF